MCKSDSGGVYFAPSSDMYISGCGIGTAHIFRKRAAAPQLRTKGHTKVYIKKTQKPKVCLLVMTTSINKKTHQKHRCKMGVKKQH